MAIHRHGGLSGAARALGVTHATVARQLDRAEAEAGVKLFDRFQSGLTATQAGTAAVARAERIEAELLALDLEMTPDDAGPLALTVPPLLMATHLSADLTDFARTYPRIQLAIYSDNRVLDLHRREADLALRVTRTPAQSLWGRKISDNRAGYFSTRQFASDHAAALAGSADPVPVISFTAWPRPLPTDLADSLPGAYVAAICDDMPAALGLAAAGLGLVRAPCFAAATNPALVGIGSLPWIDYSPIWCLTHPDLRRTPKVRLMMQFLADRFARSADLYTTAAAA